jgi:RNA 2',3'-cyclic 3'-phosphodiesterase
MSSKRLFVGARVSTQTANALAAASEMLQRRGRDAGLDLKFVAATSYHVTLKFLGWTRDEAIPALVDALEAAVIGVAPFRFRTARLGAFPSLEKASVVWAGLEDGAAMSDVAARVEAACERLGFPRETRPYHPHVTLARIAGAQTRAVKDVVLPLSEQMFSESRVDGVILFESETKPGGSVYREVSRIAFKQAENAPKRQTGALELGDETDDGWPRGHGQ